MKIIYFFLVPLLAIFLAISAVPCSAQGNSAQGTLTVNEETYQIKHAYVYEDGDELVVVLLDNPVSQDNVPFDVGDMAYDQDLHGVSVSISRTTKQIVDNPLYNAVYHKVWLGRGALLNPGKVTVSTFDDSVLEGRLFMEKPDAIFDHSYSYDITFKVHLGSGDAALAPAEVTVSGDDTPAGKAYASYYRAKLAGDLEGVKKMVVRENVKDLEGEMGKMMIEMSMMTDPREIDIAKTDVSGDSADLTVKGMTADKGSATGHVKMVVEDGQWKVLMDKWEMKY